MGATRVTLWVELCQARRAEVVGFLTLNGRSVGLTLAVPQSGRSGSGGASAQSFCRLPALKGRWSKSSSHHSRSAVAPLAATQVFWTVVT